MSYIKRDCFLCTRKGLLEIGENTSLQQHSILKQCPQCNGRGFLTINYDPFGLWGDKWKR